MEKIEIRKKDNELIIKYSEAKTMTQICKNIVNKRDSKISQKIN